VEKKKERTIEIRSGCADVLRGQHWDDIHDPAQRSVTVRVLSMTSILTPTNDPSNDRIGSHKKWELSAAEQFRPVQRAKGRAGRLFLAEDRISFRAPIIFADARAEIRGVVGRRVGGRGVGCADAEQKKSPKEGRSRRSCCPAGRQQSIARGVHGLVPNCGGPSGRR